MSSRPLWFMCDDCLFMEENLCFFNTVAVPKVINDFCSNWKCKNCWESFDSWNFVKDDLSESFVDHSQCSRVEFK